MPAHAPIQFASPAWIDLVEQIVHEEVAGLRAQGLGGDWNLSFSQVWTDVPPDAGVGRWALLFKNGQTEFTREPVLTDIGITGPYKAILPIARFEFGGASALELADIYAYWNSRRASGELRDIGVLGGAPKAFQRMIMNLHDRQARLIA
jgi:hypothetical protein